MGLSEDFYPETPAKNYREQDDGISNKMYFHVSILVIQSENLDPIRESSFGCTKGVVLCKKKLYFVGTGVGKIKSEACGIRSIKLSFFFQ